MTVAATVVETQAKDVEARDLNLYYGDFLAVTEVNVRIPPNKITALIGSSGCGKSTFLRSINRMHELIPGARVEGQIVVAGEDIYGEDIDPTWIRSQIGMVFQQPNPFPTMSIYDNVVAGLKLNAQKRKKEEFDAIVERSLRGVHLWDEVNNRLDKSGSGLSGGQQQRLCIARAIAMEPDVLLMDEPCSALDPISTIAIEALMRELKVNYTIVIVTHNMQQATRVSDYTGFFNLDGVGQPGHLVEFGETEQVFSHPGEQATKDYVSGHFG
jgi:phosphate transport system ATP-binding protein